MAVTITSRTGESVAGEIPVHRHCQKTVLSASGIPSGNGATWYNISDLSEKLNYLPEKWLEKYFLFNQNITEDLASVLELINGVYGKISEISPVKHVSFYDVDNNIIGTYVPDKNGQISPKLGRKIRLMIEGQELSFATLVGSSYNVGQEINSITLPKHKLKFIKNDSTVGEADVVMDSDVNVRLPSDLISGIRLNGQINQPNSESIVDLGNVVSSIKVNGDVKTPNSNGLVDIGTFSVTNTDNNGTTISRINYNGNQYDIKMPPVSAIEVIAMSSRSDAPRWWQVYSNGWCEQGGYIESTESGAKEVNLQIPYNDTSYHVGADMIRSDGITSGDNGNAMCTKRTTDSITIWIGTTLSFQWESKGWISDETLLAIKNGTYTYYMARQMRNIKVR